MQITKTRNLKRTSATYNHFQFLIVNVSEFKLSYIQGFGETVNYNSHLTCYHEVCKEVSSGKVYHMYK